MAIIRGDAPYVFPSNVNSTGVSGRYYDALNGRAVLAPLGVKQIADFAFDWRGDEVVERTSDATDHWLEDNTAVQDHIGVKPVQVTLRGFVSELKFSKDVALAVTTALSGIQSTLSKADAYLGRYTPGAVDSLAKTISKAQAVAVQIEQASARIAQLASFFSAAPAQNKQQAAYMKLSALQMARVVFTVFTPFQVFDNMVIISLNSKQPQSTRTMSDFTVKLKQLQFASDITVGSFVANKAGRAATGSHPLIQNGGTSGVQSATTSTVSNMKTNFFAGLAI